jgi:hypothetical protein
MNIRAKTKTRYSLYKPCSVNGLKYDQQIDIAIINELRNSEYISSWNLKRKIERALGRTINTRTYSDHLKRMVTDNLLKKNDTGERGKESVFYSVTEEAEKRLKLGILRVEPKHELFKDIFTNLFLRGITEGGTYVTSNLDELLSDIHASRHDLFIERIEENHSEYDIESELANVQEKELSVSLTIYYKPVSDIRIIENVCYRKNIFYHFCTEYIIYLATIPGMSIKDLTTKYYTFKPALQDVEEAFMLLMKNHLIKPLMEFRGETKFVFADGELSQLMNDLYSFYELENKHSYVKWNYIREPTLEERERRKVFFSDKMSSQQLFNKAEINRFDFRKKIKEKKIKEELIPLTKQLEENVNKFEHAKIYYVKYIKKKYEKTIEKYAFLLGDIFRIACPLLLQE